MDKALEPMHFCRMLILVAATSLLSAPQPLNQANWFKYTDMPTAWMQNGKPYVVGFRLITAPDGRIDGCQVEVTGGSRRIDELTCALSMRRARFRPARNADGAPVYGVYRTYARWIVAAVPFKLPEVVVPTLDLKVNRLPDGLKSPAIVRVMFAVDESGGPSSCSEEPPHGPIPLTPQPKLAIVACEELLRNFKATAVTDRTGKAVPSVQDAIIRFTLN